jgi:hypothetical protein
MAAARNSDSAMKNDHTSAVGAAMPLTLQYAAMYSFSVGNPAHVRKVLRVGITEAAITESCPETIRDTAASYDDT